MLFAGLFCVVLFTSCKNKCGSTTCQNGGTCESNVCVCPIGYSGNACQTGWTDAVVGTYECKRSLCNPKSTDTLSWQSAITKDATNSGYTIDISNFDRSNVTQYGTMDSLGNISIVPSVGYGVNATGTYLNGVVSLQFTTYNLGTLIYKCEMTMTKL